MTIRLWATLALFCLAVCLLTLAGCGSSGGALRTVTTALRSGTGRASITIHWPARPAKSKLIPEATNLVTVQMYLAVNGTPKLVGSGSATRSTSTSDTIEIDNLPVGTLTVVATAYPGTTTASPGVALATGTVPLTIVDGQTANFSVTMASTIDHLSLTPANPILQPGATQGFAVTAYDGPNEATASVVLLTPSQVAWQSSTTSVATVSTSGTSATVTTVASGTTTITATDSESQKSASTAVTVAVNFALHHIQITTSGYNTLLGVLALQNGTFQTADQTSNVSPGYVGGSTGSGGFVGTYRYYADGQTVEWQYGDPANTPTFVLDLVASVPVGANITGSLQLSQFPGGTATVTVDGATVGTYTGNVTQQVSWVTASGDPVPSVSGSFHRITITWTGTAGMDPALIELSNGTFVVVDPSGATGYSGTGSDYFEVSRYVENGTGIEWEFGDPTSNFDGEMDLAAECVGSTLNGTIEVMTGSGTAFNVAIDGVAVQSYSGNVSTQSFSWAIP